MSTSIDLKAQKRDVTGKKVSALRREGFIPATIYQHGKESVNVMVEYQPFVKVFTATGYGQPVEIEIEGKKRLAMIKHVHVDPAKNTYMHVEFHAVRADKIVEAEIPVHIVGEVPAEKVGNFIVRPNDHIVVKAKPADLPESFDVSAESLEKPGDTLTVADLTVVSDVEIVSEPELTLAVVEEPRAVEEPEDADEEAVDAADVPSEHGSDSDDSSEEEKSE